MGATMVNPELRRKIKVKLRPDLTITKQRHAGQIYYIVKDPVALRYYRFREEELFLIKQFDGKNNFDDVRHEFVEKFRPQRLSVVELEKFVQQLLQAGIATVDTPQIGQRLYERFKKKRFDKFKQFFANILFIKAPLFDPDRLLAKLVPIFGFVFSVPFFIVSCLFMLSSILLVVANWRTFVDRLPDYHEFFTVRNVMYFWLTLGIVKVLHEFGHGISCKKFGGEVHEMGFLLLVMTPCLYANVTDSWMLPNKWHRVIIGAAGIYVELIISAIFVWVWWYTNTGLFNTLALATIFICSVSTVLFNGNPLLRYDGYYILSDLIEIPNLRERSNRYLGNCASIFFFGTEAVPDPFMPKQNRWFFIFYAIAAYLYRWVVTFGILWFFYNLLKPYKLHSISALLATLAIVPLAILPIRNIYKTLRNRWRQMKVDKARMAAGILVGVGLVVAVLLTPFPMWISAPMILLPRNATTVFIQEKGILTELFVTDGQEVAPGTLLARLKDPELSKEHERLRQEYEQSIQAVRSFRAMSDERKVNAAQFKADYTQQRINNLETQIAKLDITVPEGVSGVVFTPPKEHDLGKLFKPKDVFCQVGDRKDLEAFIVVQESDIGLIKDLHMSSGVNISMKFSGHVGEIQKGKVSNISSTEIVELPPPLSNKHGGEVATTTDKDQHIERPLVKSYSLQVVVPNPDNSLGANVRGVVRIEIGWRSFYWRLMRTLQQTFHFKM